MKNTPLFIDATKGMNAKVIENVPYDILIRELISTKVYCQLSYTDQFPLNLLEAMACGCIPVVSNSGGPPEIVGNVGFIVSYGDVVKTREAISLALLSTPADITSTRERATIFSIE